MSLTDAMDGGPPPAAGSSPAADLAAEFARMAIHLHTEVGFTATVGGVSRLALQAVGCTQAGVVLAHRRGRLETAAATDPLVAQADQLQVEFGEGPAFAVLAGEVSTVIADTSVDRRWLAWSPGAAGLGLRSVLAIGLQTGDTTLGVLELFHAQPDRFGADKVHAALLLAAHASIAIANARQEATLRDAMDGRRLIGQAQGLLMERFSVDADRAFAILRRYSQDQNRKLRDVAADVLDTRQLPR